MPLRCPRHARISIGLMAMAAMSLACGSDNDAIAADAASCAAADNLGIEPGQRIADIDLRACDGSTVPLLSKVCGQKLTLLDIGAAAFDECIAATDAYATDPVYDGLQSRGLQIVQVFARDADLDTPTTLFCQEYSDAHAIDFVFLIDQLRNTSLFAETYPLNLVLDPGGVVIHKWHESIPDDKAMILSDLLDL